MTYFLDFDRTLFDYDTFKTHLETISEWKSFVESPLWRVSPDTLPVPTREERRAFWEEVDRWYAAGGYSFKPEQFRGFLFPDTEKFLAKHGQSSVIVTAGGEDTTYQKDKVASSGVTDLVHEVCLVPGRDISKATFVVELVQRYPGPYVFVDDLPWHLDDVAKALPAVSVYEMRRDGKPGCGRHQVITTLDELL
jgi:FMN phosphatase YigB (HAD superfamily)